MYRQNELQVSSDTLLADDDSDGDDGGVAQDGGHTSNKWNFWRLSEYELAGNEIFLRHDNSGDWG